MGVYYGARFMRKGRMFMAGYGMGRVKVPRKKVVAETSFPTIPCCKVMSEGYPCECCEVVDA